MLNYFCQRVLVFFLLIFSMPVPPSLNAQTPDLCGQYTAQIRDSLQIVDSLLSQDLSQVDRLGSTYLSILQMRIGFENDPAVPDCTLHVHDLMLDYLTAQNDVLALSLAWFADVSNRSGYENLFQPVLNRASSKRAALESELSQFGTIISDTSPENLATQAAADDSLPIVPPPVIEQPAPGFLPTVTPAPVLSATPPPLPPPTATITIAPTMPPLPPPTATDYRFFQSSPTPL